MVIDLIAVVLVGTVIAMGWQLDEFGRSLTAVSPATLDAYHRDLRSFVTWAERLSLDGPAAVDRQTLRRYLAYLATRGTARRTIARRASALRRYFRWARRTGLVTDDPSAGLSAPKGEARLPRAMADPSWDPERIALRAEVVGQIQAALLKLAPEQRLALILSDVQGLPYEEIARVMDTSLGTVKSRIARARGHLRAILAQQPELFGHSQRPGTGRGHDAQ